MQKHFQVHTYNYTQYVAYLICISRVLFRVVNLFVVVYDWIIECSWHGFNWTRQVTYYAIYTNHSKYCISMHFKLIQFQFLTVSVSVDGKLLRSSRLMVPKLNAGKTFTKQAQQCTSSFRFVCYYNKHLSSLELWHQQKFFCGWYF